MLGCLVSEKDPGMPCLLHFTTDEQSSKTSLMPQGSSLAEQRCDASSSSRGVGDKSAELGQPRLQNFPLSGWLGGG